MLTNGHGPAPHEGRRRSTRLYLARWSRLNKQTLSASKSSDILKHIRSDSQEASASTDLSSAGFSEHPSLSNCPGECGGRCEQRSPGPRQSQGGPHPSGSHPGHRETPEPHSAGRYVDAGQPRAHVPGQPPPLSPFALAAAVWADAKS